MDCNAKILIVEDSKTQAMLLEYYLKEAGFTTFAVENGQLALDFINNSDDSGKFYPDIVLSDVNMPEMGGFELSNILKNQHPEIFIIMLTASQDIADLKQSFDSGAVDFINKPVNKVELLVRMKNILRIKNAEKNLKMTLAQLEENNKKLETLSITDPLTKLYNRKKIMKRINECMTYSNRYKTSLSITMIDLDHFKKVNDTYGHQAGDEVLVKVSEVLKSNIRETDIAGRYGGEEFIIIAPGINASQCCAMMNKILELTRNLTFKFDTDYKITFSAGIKEYQGETVDTLISKADKQLYKVKESGRNRVEIFKD